MPRPDTWRRLKLCSSEISRTSVTTRYGGGRDHGWAHQESPPWAPLAPMKLRLLEDRSSRALELVVFMPRHIEQPALRHWKPAPGNLVQALGLGALATC